MTEIVLSQAQQWKIVSISAKAYRQQRAAMFPP
jgi:hypothetical protein